MTVHRGTRPTSIVCALAVMALGAAAVLAGSGITNTGPTTIDGDVGTFPTRP